MVPSAENQTVERPCLDQTRLRGVLLIIDNSKSKEKGIKTPNNLSKQCGFWPLSPFSNTVLRLVQRHMDAQTAPGTSKYEKSKASSPDRRMTRANLQKKNEVRGSKSEVCFGQKKSRYEDVGFCLGFLILESLSHRQSRKNWAIPTLSAAGPRCLSDSGPETICYPDHLRKYL